MMGVCTSTEKPAKIHKLGNREGTEPRRLSSTQVTCRCKFKDSHAEYMGQHFPTHFYTIFDILCVYFVLTQSMSSCFNSAASIFQAESVLDPQEPWGAN